MAKKNGKGSKSKRNKGKNNAKNNKPKKSESKWGGPKAQKNARLVLGDMLIGGRPSSGKKSKLPNVGSWSSPPRNGGKYTPPPSKKDQRRQARTDKAWKKVLKKLEIKKYNNRTADDVFAYVNGSSSYKGGGNGKGGDNSAPRDTGEYKDIKKAQEEDRKAGQEMAKKLQEMEAQLGGISPEVQAQLDSLTLANTNLSNELSSSATQYQERLDAAAAQSAAAMQRMESLMLQQQQSAMQTQQLLQSQLASTQNALQTQQRMSANLATAYVPQAEASAQSVSYGDARRTRRRQTDNSLSDLSIVSGVGTNNATAGLQLAG